MRTSFCIIMAAVLSLCLFGVGSDVKQSAQDTAQSDSTDRSINDTIAITQDAPFVYAPDHTSLNSHETTSEPFTEETDQTPKQTLDSSSQAVTSADITIIEAPRDTCAEISDETEEIKIEIETTTSHSSYSEEINDDTPSEIKPDTSAYTISLQTRSAAAVAGGLTDGSTVSVYDHDTGSYMSITLREYITGVVAAEMPISFSEEALRAQAIAARTYAIYKLCRGGNSEHPGAAICNAPEHCCAFVPVNAASDKWGKDATAVLETASRAVTDTENTVIIYEDECICAAWHSSSVGYTKNASDVWGGDVAYLCSVPTEEDRHSAGHGVGMSQYGANEMAKSGALAVEILTHYYTGCTVVRIG